MDDVKVDLLNILYIARSLASSDGEYHPAEKEAFRKIMKAMEVNNDEFQLISDLKKPIQSAILELQNSNAIQLLIDVLLVMASVDNRLDDHEKKFLAKVMGLLDIDAKEHPFLQDKEVKEVQAISENLDNFISIIQKKAAALRN